MKSCKSFQWEMGYKSKFYKETWFYFMPPQYPIKWKLKTQVCTTPCQLTRITARSPRAQIPPSFYPKYTYFPEVSF